MTQRYECCPYLPTSFLITYHLPFRYGMPRSWWRVKPAPRRKEVVRESHCHYRYRFLSVPESRPLGLETTGEMRLWHENSPRDTRLLPILYQFLSPYQRFLTGISSFLSMSWWSIIGCICYFLYWEHPSSRSTAVWPSWTLYSPRITPYNLISPTAYLTEEDLT